MIAVLIVFVTFGGIALCIGVIAFSILIANGKITLPHTEARRLQHERVQTQIVESRLERERLQMMLDKQIELRLGQATARAQLEEADV